MKRNHKDDPNNQQYFQRFFFSKTAIPMDFANISSLKKIFAYVCMAVHPKSGDCSGKL